MLKPDGTLPAQVICRNHDDRVRGQVSAVLPHALLLETID